MPWFNLCNSDKQFFVDDADVPAISAFGWRSRGGVPYTRGGRRSRAIEYALGLPPLKGTRTRKFLDGNNLNFSRANYSIVYIDRFTDKISNIDNRIGVSSGCYKRYFEPHPRFKRRSRRR